MTPSTSGTEDGSAGRRAVSLDEVRHVAELANLRLTPDEEPALAHDLNRILDFIAQLSEVDTEGVSPMAQVSEVLGGEPAGEGETLRPDGVRPSVDRAAVLRSAPETDGRFFKVPKVIER